MPSRSDDAERWLEVYDPDYDEESKGWGDLRGGEYRAPKEEIAWGDPERAAEIVPKAKIVDMSGRESTRLCEACGEPFEPTRWWAKYCNPKTGVCKQRGWRKKQKEKRASRRAC
jgi:hypothetical protein